MSRTFKADRVKRAHAPRGLREQAIEVEHRKDAHDRHGIRVTSILVTSILSLRADPIERRPRDTLRETGIRGGRRWDDAHRSRANGIPRICCR